MIIEAVETISDNKAISFEVGLHNNERIEKKIEFRNIKKLSPKMFADNLNENFGQYLQTVTCNHETKGATGCVDCLTAQYRKLTEEFVDKHAPVIKDSKFC